MQIINKDPVRYILEQTVKKRLFSKKEVTKYAIGDENGQPLTGYDWAVIHPYEDGISMAQRHPQGIKFPLDLMGQEILKAYAGYQVRPKNGYLFIALSHKSMTVEQILDMRPSGIILSPGPGRPEDAGVCIGLIKRIGQVHDTSAGQPGEADMPAAFGARVGYAKELMHGKTSLCRIDTASRIFAGLEAVEQVGRYHSLAAVEETMPDCLKITARTEDDEIMAVEHTRYPVFGIQFHPESIMTPEGSKMINNVIHLRV